MPLATSIMCSYTVLIPGTDWPGTRMLMILLAYVAAGPPDLAPTCIQRGTVGAVNQAIQATELAMSEL
jgi:hypothetical protein